MYEMQNGAPGLKFNFDESISTLAATADMDAGAPVFVREGDAGKGYPTAASTVSGVAAEFESTISGTTSADGTPSITINGTTYTGENVASGANATAVAAAIVAAAAADPVFDVSNEAGVITVAAKSTGTAANSAVITLSVPTGATAGTVTRTVNGVDEVGASHFRGVIVRGNTTQKYLDVAALPVLTRGKIWIRVAANVVAHKAAFITAEGGFGASGTEINGRYLTDAAAEGLAILELFDN
jgi:hypothetical protein